MSKQKGRQIETAFLDWTDEEILAALADKSVPKDLRQRLLRHAKAVGLRNVQKRERQRRK